MILLSGVYLALTICLIILFFVLLAILVVILLKKNKGRVKVKVDDELIFNLINYLGGSDNISSYNNDGSRVKFELKDLDKANLDELKTISSGGVFVTGNFVKVPFAYASEDVIKILNKVLK